MEESGRIEELLEEIVRWSRIAAVPVVRGWLEPVLTTTEERKAYQASVGATRHEVASAAGVSDGTVSNYWNRWKQAHPPIVREGAWKGRVERLYDLAEMNIPIEAEAGD